MIRPMHHTVFYFTSLGVLLLLGGVLAVLNFWLFWPYRTLEIIGYSDVNPLPLEQTTVHPGDPIEYVLNYCKYTTLSSTVRRTMIDGQIITLVDTSGRLPSGCHKAIVKTAIVPETINPGNYYLDVLVDYKVNPIRTETIHYRTQYFQVVKGEVVYEKKAETSVDIVSEDETR